MEHIFTDENFTQEVLQSPIPVLVDFWAEWCGPCRMMSPIVEEVGRELDAAKFKVGKMNVDENPETPQKYGIMSIPSFFIFQDGKAVEQFSGGMLKEAFRAKVMKYV